MPSAAEWDERFRRGDHASTGADPLLDVSRGYWPLIFGWRARQEGGPESGAGLKALDAACGAGRHAVALARAGFAVTAADFSEQALETARKQAEAQGVSLHTWQADLEDPATDLSAACYDLVAVFFYLHRPLFLKIRRCLRPGGLIVYKTYSVDQLRYPGRPRHKVHMLEHNELLREFEGFRVLHYHEEWNGKGTAALIAQKP